MTARALTPGRRRMAAALLVVLVPGACASACGSRRAVEREPEVEAPRWVCVGPAWEAPPEVVGAEPDEPLPETQHLLNPFTSAPQALAPLGSQETHAGTEPHRTTVP